MTVDELYDYITSQMTPERALKNILASSLEQFEIAKGCKAAEGISPIPIIATCAIELGWSICIPDGDPNTPVTGMVIGTDEYLNSVVKQNADDNS